MEKIDNNIYYDGKHDADNEEGNNRKIKNAIAFPYYDIAGQLAKEGYVLAENQQQTYQYYSAACDQ